jgi:hypothetical protein
MNIILPFRIGKLVMLLMLTSTVLQAQQLKLGANPASLQKSALLELESPSQGLLLSRINDTTQSTMTSAPDGMLIFSKYDNTLRLRANGYWQKVLTNSAITSLNGQQQPVQQLVTSYTPAGSFQFTSAAGIHTLTVPDASASQYGFVNAGAQTFGGNKTFNGNTLFGGSTTMNGVVNMNGLTVDNTKDSVILIDGGMLYKRRLPGVSSGTVTSVGLSMPGIFSVTGSPVTTSGTLTASFNTQTANQVFAGPAAGAAAAPTFRNLVATDIPSLAGSYIQNLGSGTQTANYAISGNGSIGGSLLLPSFTSGSVLFMNGTTVAQSNADFFWDNTNKRLGIGVTNPNNKLEIAGTVATTGLSGLRLKDLGTATPQPSGSKVLSVNNNGDVFVMTNAAANNWLITGNSNVDANTQFLGTLDDRKMVIKSNNQSFLEFGRRATLGLTQGYTDYNDDNEKVTFLRSALQFDVPATVQFYKPKMFTDANGNFRLKGSSAGTDLFELGATGSNNDGGFEFIIGDDGDEPIVFKSYNFAGPSYTEFMRMESGKVGINMAGATPAANLDVEGTFKLGANGTVLDNIIKTTVTLNTGNIGNGGNGSATATIAGVAVGDAVIVNPRSNLPGIIISSARVSAANTIRVAFVNLSGGTTNVNTSFDITIIQ